MPKIYICFKLPEVLITFFGVLFVVVKKKNTMTTEASASNPTKVPSWLPTSALGTSMQMSKQRKHSQQLSVIMQVYRSTCRGLGGPKGSMSPLFS